MQSVANARFVHLAVLFAAVASFSPPAGADQPPPEPAPAPAPPEAVAPSVDASTLFVEPDLGAPDPERIVVPGDVALYGRDQIAFVELFARAFDLGLGAPERERLADALAHHVRDVGPLERQRWLALIDAHEQVDADEAVGRGDAVNAALERFRIDLDALLAVHPEGALQRSVAQVLDLARTATWPGQPPLDGISASAYVEAARFVAGLGRNERIVLTEGQRRTLEEHLRAQLAGRDAKDRDALREVASLWNRVRRTWGTLSPTARLRARGTAAVLLVRLVPNRPSAEDRAVPTVASEILAISSEARGLGGPFTATTNVALNPRHVRHVLRSAFQDVAPEATSLAQR